MKQVKYCYLI